MGSFTPDQEWRYMGRLPKIVGEVQAMTTSVILAGFTKRRTGMPWIYWATVDVLHDL